jgi:hypothetical protein
MAAIKSGAMVVINKSSARSCREGSRVFAIAVHQMNAFHDQLHDLRTGDDCASPADHSPFPVCGPRLMRNSEIIGDCRAADTLVGDVEHVGVAAPTAGVATASSGVGGGQERLNAMACEIMVQRGKTRASVRRLRLQIGPRKSWATSINKHAQEYRGESRAGLPGRWTS